MEIKTKGGNKYIIIDDGQEYHYDVDGITFISDDAMEMMETHDIDTDGYYTPTLYADTADTADERARDMYIAEYCMLEDSIIWKSKIEERIKEQTQP